jgi:hypothetical protein
MTATPGRRATDSRAGLGARCRPDPQRRPKGVRRLPALRRRARDRRAAPGQETEQLYAEAEKLHRQRDRYAYGPPQIRFTDADVDQARAAGVLIEFDGAGRPIIVDRPLYRELVKGAIKRTHDELEAKPPRQRRRSRPPAPAGSPPTR